jgi:ribulose-5-phosphate 4-epimerase/fuculose-1-phosphate aldolase
MFEDVKEQVAIANRILSEFGLATGLRASLGHSSMRVPGNPDRFIVKGRGYKMDALPRMQPEDMIVCDLEGYKVEGPPGTTQCFEVKMHSCIYKTHPEVLSVTHVHPQYIILMSVLNPELKPMCQEGVQLVAKPLPVYPHVKTVQTDEEGMEVANLLGDSKAILLEGHGAATTGRSLEESVMNMLQLEEQAKMNYLAYCADGKDHRSIPMESVREMSGRKPTNELPHFKDSMSGVRPAGGGGGVWMYYSEIVSKDL